MIKKKIISGIIWNKTAPGRMILTISKRRKRFSENKQEQSEGGKRHGNLHVYYASQIMR